MKEVLVWCAVFTITIIIGLLLPINSIIIGALLGLISGITAIFIVNKT